MEIFMKTMFSSISRLFFAYSKFIVMVTILSGFSTGANSSEIAYLECDARYFKLTGTYLESNYNIRAKKFTNKSKIYSYKSDFINLGYGEINRNTGEWKDSHGDTVCILKKINRDELPKINQEGKLF